MAYNYRMLIQYDGTRYAGWQKQGNTDATVQGKLEHLLSRLCGYEIEVFGAGRTDAGVHAAGQVANFKLETQENTDELVKKINQYLPEDIAVIHLEEAEARFHSRLNAEGKDLCVPHLEQLRAQCIRTPVCFAVSGETGYRSNARRSA